MARCLRVIHGHGIPWRIRDVQGCSGALANTLDVELEGTGVSAFTIGPGLVPTQTASNAVEYLAPLMGMTVTEFFAMNKAVVLTPEEAGTESPFLSSFCRAIQGDGDFVHPGVEGRGHQFRGR